MEKHSPHTIIECPQDTFRMAVLLQSVGTSKAKHHAVHDQERMQVGIVKFAPVICLNAHDLSLELCLDKGMERDDRGKNIRLMRSGKLQVKCVKSSRITR